MLRKIVLFLLQLLMSLNAYAIFDDDAYTMFNTNKNQLNEVTITWVTVKDIQKSCEAESRRRGNDGFSYAVDACSFWDDKRDWSGKLKRTCQIYTTKKTNNDTLGHEVRHCYQGAYHK
jgi:hypothetical protein